MASLAWLFVAHLARAGEGAYARAGFNVQQAATYAGRTTALAAGYARGREYTLGLNAELTGRRYANGVQIRDDQFNLGGSKALGEHVYVDAAAGGATTADIFARWSASVAPHYVVNGNDFGLGFRFAEYRTGQTGALNASYLHYFANGLTLGSGAYLVRADENIAAYSAQALYAPDERHLVRVTAAAGRTLEDRGLQADFNSLTTEYTYACRAGFSAGLTWTDYWSEVRRERVLGFRLGWR